MVNYKSQGGHEVGSQFGVYTKDGKKTMGAEAAGRLNLDNHSLHMKVNNKGAASFLFGWKQNANIDALVGTEVDLSKAGTGDFGSFPLGFQFDMKY